MAIPIRIKRSTGSTAPTSLLNAELAFVEGTDILYYGEGTGGAGGSATSVIQIGGLGAMLGLAAGNTQTAAGTYTFSGSVTFSGTTALGAATATSPGESDDSTRVATTEWVLDRIGAFGAGTVTSVGLSLPNLFTVSGSPVTSSGTLSATLAVQAANKVWAGPTTGSDAAPAFRSLVAADIPDLSGTYLTSETYTGTVTSVGLSLPNIFTISGSPVTSSGTLTGTLATQTANYVWAGPTTGAAAAPAFRALVAADVPDLSATYLSLSGTQTASGTYTFSGTANLTGTFQIGSTTVTASAAELNILDGVTANKDELNVLDGITSSTAELNILDGVTSTASELNLVDGSVANTVVNSKAVIYGAAGEVAAGSITTTGNVTVGGDLTVNGTVTTINSTTITVDDKNLELGSTASPTDATADGGGITLKGDTDHTIIWLDATDAWTFSEHVDLASGKEFKINGTSVLSGSTLGSGVTSSSLTTVGTIGTGTWQGTTVGVAYGGTGLTAAAKGSVLVANDTNTLSALDGGGTADKLLLYTASSDTISWVSELDGGSF